LGVSVPWLGLTPVPRDKGSEKSKLAQASQAYSISEMMRFIIVQSLAKLCSSGLTKGTFYPLVEGFILSMIEGTMTRPIA